MEFSHFSQNCDYFSFLVPENKMFIKDTFALLPTGRWTVRSSPHHHNRRAYPSLLRAESSAYLPPAPPTPGLRNHAARRGTKNPSSQQNQTNARSAAHPVEMVMVMSLLSGSLFGCFATSATPTVIALVQKRSIELSCACIAVFLSPAGIRVVEEST